MSACIILKDRMKYLLLPYKKKVLLFWSLFYIVISFYISSILSSTQAFFFAQLETIFITTSVEFVDTIYCDVR